MKVWPRVKAWLSLLAAMAVAAPMVASAYPADRQNGNSKALLSLSPNEADQVRRRDLLANLQPEGQFLADLNGNVYAMTFLTWPHKTRLDFVCREERITLYSDSAIEAGKIEAQPLFYVEQRPSIGGYGQWQGCDKSHPGPKANWIEAPTDLDAVRAVETFRMAEIAVENGSLKPACGHLSPDTCRQRTLSLANVSKIDAVAGCAPSPDEDVCYVISVGGSRLTIGAMMSPDQTAPTATTSIKVEEIITVIE